MLYATPSAPTPIGAITGMKSRESRSWISSGSMRSISPTRPMSTISPSLGVALQQHLARMDERAVLPGEADGLAAVLVDEADDFLIELAQHHFDDVHHAIVGDPHALAELALDAHLLQQVADLRAAAVDDDRVHPDELQHHDVAGEARLQRGLDHRVAAVLDDDRLVVEALDVGQRLGENLRLHGGIDGVDRHGGGSRAGRGVELAIDCTGSAGRRYPAREIRRRRGPGGRVSPDCSDAAGVDSAPSRRELCYRCRSCRAVCRSAGFHDVPARAAARSRRPPRRTTAPSNRALMRLAIVRQDYRPEGAVERVTERALEALLERNVAISLYTRSWPQTRLQLIEPLIIDPFHVGALWRDWGFARAACRDVRRSQPSLVESHERLLCCDVYRAGDGVHAVWLEERLKRATPAGRIAAMLSPHNRYLLRIEQRLYASPWLRAVICDSKMVRDEIRSRFAVPESKLHVIYNPVDSDLFHPGLRAERATIVERHGIDAAATVYLLVAADFARADLGTAIDALAQLAPPAHLVVVGRRPGRRALSRARAGAGRRRSRHARRRRGRPAAVLRRGRRVRAALALRSVARRRARSAWPARCP